MERVARPNSGRHGYYRYSSGRMYSFRPTAAARPAPAVLAPLATLGILRYRGKRGGGEESSALSRLLPPAHVTRQPSAIMRARIAHATIS